MIDGMMKFKPSFIYYVNLETHAVFVRLLRVWKTPYIIELLIITVNRRDGLETH